MHTVDSSLNELLSHGYGQPLEINEPILTDDLAPVEYYSSLAQREYLSQRR
jgi:hypothetical protein